MSKSGNKIPDELLKPEIVDDYEDDPPLDLVQPIGGNLNEKDAEEAIEQLEIIEENPPQPNFNDLKNIEFGVNFPAPPQFKFNGDNKPLFADPVKSLGNGATISGPVERPTILLRPNLDIPPPPLGFSQRLPEFRNQGLRRGEPLDAQNIFISPRKPYKIPISPSQSPKLNLPLPAYTKKPSTLFEKGNSVVTAPQGPQQTISSGTIVVPVEESEVFPPQASPVLQAETTEKNVKTTEDPRKYYQLQLIQDLNNKVLSSKLDFNQ